MKLSKGNFHKVNRFLNNIIIIEMFIFSFSFLMFLSITKGANFFDYNLVEVVSLLFGTALLSYFTFKSNKNNKKNDRIELTCNTISKILVTLESDEITKTSFLIDFKKITNNYQLLKTLVSNDYVNLSLLDNLDSKLSDFSDYVENNKAYNNNNLIFKDDKYFHLLSNIESALNVIIQDIYKK